MAPMGRFAPGGRDSAFAYFYKKNMSDTRLLEYLEGFLSDERKQRFTDVLSRRTNYLTVAVEDVFQLHNTSAVMRSCEVFGVQTIHVIEERYGKTIDKEIAMGAQKWVDVERYENVTECIDALKTKGYRNIATTPIRKIACWPISICQRLPHFFSGPNAMGYRRRSSTGQTVFSKSRWPDSAKA